MNGAPARSPDSEPYAYRGFVRKGDRVLGHNIIVVPHLRYGLKRRSGTLGPYQTLTKVWYNDPGGQNTVSFPATIQI